MKRFLSIFLIIVLILAIILYLRPLPTVSAQSTVKHSTTNYSVNIPWPDYGQAAFGALGYGVLATNGQQKSTPIASIAKIVTALSVLHQKPLSLDQQGPDLTMGSTDVALYNKYVAENGSVVPVNDGEQITEYQMLEAMLLPSGNNIADSLANWAFGSQSAYVSYANSYVKSLGLNQTHIADSSGFSPNSVSSAQDLVKLGETALANPVIAGVVSKKTATIPVAGSVNNVNWLLGIDGNDGIKTGNTDQAGGCFLFSAKQTVGNENIEIIGAVLGAPENDSPTQAIDDSQPMIEATSKNFHEGLVASAGEAVGTYKTPWGATATAVAKQTLSMPVWNGNKATVSENFKPIKGGAAAGASAGTLTLTSGNKTENVPIVLKNKIAAPSPLWRIFHI